MSKTRLDKLEAAIRSLQQRATANGRAAASGLPLEYRAVKPYAAKLSAYVMSEEESLAVQDQLLGLGGATIWANGEMLEGWETPEEVADRQRELTEAGFVRDNGRWVMPTRETEITFLRAWLAEADKAGRPVYWRASIESWISCLGDNAKVAAPVTFDAPVEPLPGLEEHVPNANKSRARQLRRQEGSVGQTYTMADRQAALDRRRNRLNH